MPQTNVKHEPTKETRSLVKALTSFGIDQSAIAAKIGVSEPTLRKHYRDEIDTGTTDLVATVANKLFNRAMTEKGMPGVTAGIFILKARGKWRDAQVVEHTDANGGQIVDRGRQVVVVLPDNGRDVTPRLNPPKIIEGEAVEIKG